MAAEHQVAIIYALIHGFLDDVAVETIRDFEDGFHNFFDEQAKEVLKLIVDKKELSEDVVTALEKAINDYKNTQNA
jgi:F-type H+-transporting ATPase subunit alpha